MELGFVFLLFFGLANRQLPFATWLGRMPVDTAPGSYAG
jgi:hypothetical protein